MLCRQPYKLQDLIQIKLPEAEQPVVEPEAAPAEQHSRQRRTGEPQYSQHHTMDHFEAFALPAQLELPLRSMASLPQQLLTHIRVACGAGASLPGKRDDKHALSTKMQQLLKDLRHIMQEANTGDGSTGKAVVFSNHKEAISHCTQVLEDQQIGSVRIMKGDTADEVRNAVLRSAYLLCLAVARGCA